MALRSEVDVIAGECSSVKVSGQQGEKRVRGNDYTLDTVDMLRNKSHIYYHSSKAFVGYSKASKCEQVNGKVSIKVSGQVRMVDDNNTTMDEGWYSRHTHNHRHNT